MKFFFHIYNYRLIKNKKKSFLIIWIFLYITFLIFKSYFWNIPKEYHFKYGIVLILFMERSIEELLGRTEIQKVSKVTSKVFHVIHSRWPINPLEVAEHMQDRGKVKTLSAKYLYHFKKLAKKELIHIKKVGNTYIAWPAEIEKLRVIHELLKGI